MSDMDCTLGREPCSVAASLRLQLYYPSNLIQKKRQCCKTESETFDCSRKIAKCVVSISFESYLLICRRKHSLCISRDDVHCWWLINLVRLKMQDKEWSKDGNCATGQWRTRCQDQKIQDCILEDHIARVENEGPSKKPLHNVKTKKYYS